MRPLRKYKILLLASPASPLLDVASTGFLVCATYPGFPHPSELLRKTGIDAVLINASSDSVHQAIRFAADLREFTAVPCILVTCASSEDLAIEALNAGIRLYFKHPVSPVRIHDALAEFLGRDVPRSATPGSCPSSAGTERLIGCSRAICELREYISRIAACQSNVLITGETGSGKELVAELIHANSTRHAHAFVCLNSAAIPDPLLESELFGYERGAFTGAIGSHRGKLAMAHKGTLFFDEIGDVSISAQAKLLRAIEGKTVYRLGGEKEFSFDVRILAATNQDLDAAIRQSRFRSDLYYRLNVVRIEVPPLRDRRDDIPMLLDHYIAYFNASLGSQIEGFTSEALSQLVSYEWPGNIRELKNVVEAVFVGVPHRRVDLASLPPCVGKYLSGPRQPAERDALLSALVATNWNKTKAADRLQWSRMTLYRKMVAHNIVRTDALH